MAIKDLGPVTAYAYAVQGGYTGTEQEFTEALGQAGITLAELEGLRAVATTLAEGQQATASYANGVLTLGIPRGATGSTGAKGDKGDTGETGNGIESIVLTSTVGSVKTYTITFTDGTTTTFEVKDGEVTNDEFYKSFIVKSSSGEIASLTDGGDDLPMKSLKVNIVPKQSGSGDPSPSNVRPISGYDEVNSYVAGGNIFDKNLYPFLHDESNNGWYISGARLLKGGASNATVGMPCKPNTSYRIAFTIGYPLARIAYGKMADLSFQTGSTSQTVYNTQADTTTIGYREVIYQTGADATFLFIQFPYGYHEEGLNSLTIQEITNTYTISLGQTVYGGTLEVCSGKLVIDRAMVDLGTRDWASRSAADRHIFRTLVNGLDPAIAYPQNSNIPTTAICEQYKAMGYSPISASDNYKFAIGTPGDPLLVIIDFDYSTAEDFKTAMNGVKLVYPLATPIEVTLTPTQVTTLLGNNNIWSDSGTVEVEYRADTTLAYNELVAMILENIGN